MMERYEKNDQWRQDPVSRKQMWALHKWLRMDTRYLDSFLTKGEASDLLGKLAHNEIKKVDARAHLDYLQEYKRQWAAKELRDKEKEDAALDDSFDFGANMALQGVDAY